MKDNAWFVGFAPRSAPEIVVVAFYEHGEHGQFAAPLARDVIKAYFDKKARLSAQVTQPKPFQPPTVGLVRPENPQPGGDQGEEPAAARPAPTPF
jgi:hypothetical protein